VVKAGIALRCNYFNMENCKKVVGLGSHEQETVAHTTAHHHNISPSIFLPPPESYRPTPPGPRPSEMSLTFSEEQRELRRQRHLSRKEVRRPPRGDLGHYLSTALQSEQAPSSSRMLAAAAATTTMTGGAAVGTDAGVTMTATIADALMTQPERPHTTRNSFGVSGGQTAANVGTAASAHRPRTAGYAGNSSSTSSKKKKPPSRAQANDDIAHVTADLGRIRLRAVKDARKTWRAAETFMMPSTRSQLMVVQLLDEEPIPFRSQEIKREDMFDRYRHFKEYDRIREEVKQEKKQKSVTFH